MNRMSVRAKTSIGKVRVPESGRGTRAKVGEPARQHARRSHASRGSLASTRRPLCCGGTRTSTASKRVCCKARPQ